MRLRYVLLLTLLLAACNPQTAPTPTPFIPTATLQGPVVPTRVTPTPSPTDEATQTQTSAPTTTATHTATLTATNSPEPIITASATVTLTITPTSAPAENQITYGAETTGLIDDANPVYLYTFSAAAGDVVTINHQVTSGNLDPFLRLLDETGRELAANDDARNNTRDAALIDLTLPTEGQYTLVVSRFGEETGASTGEFILTLEQSATAATQASPQVIAYNELIMGSITNTLYESRYTFEAAEGDVITIDLEAVNAGLDPFLILLDAAGDELARNDDRSPRTRDSQITAFTVPESGIYTVIATRYNGETGGTVGSYTLTITDEADTNAGE